MELRHHLFKARNFSSSVDLSVQRNMIIVLEILAVKEFQRLKALKLLLPLILPQFTLKVQ